MTRGWMILSVVTSAMLLVFGLVVVATPAIAALADPNACWALCASLFGLPFVWIGIEGFRTVARARRDQRERG